MKTKSFFVIAMTFLFVLSCSTENVEYEQQLESQKLYVDVDSELNSTSRNQPSCSILPAIVEGNYCVSSDGIPGSTYTAWATAGSNYVNYDRQVELYIVDSDQSIIETKLVKIKANTGGSNNVPIFYNESSSVGRVTIKIANVVNLSTGAYDYSCNFLETSAKVNNCYQSNTSGNGGDPCGDGTTILDEDGEEISTDEDGDGICVFSDPDDNDPCNPIPTHPSCQD